MAAKPIHRPLRAPTHSPLNSLNSLPLPLGLSNPNPKPPSILPASSLPILIGCCNIASLLHLLSSSVIRSSFSRSSSKTSNGRLNRSNGRLVGVAKACHSATRGVLPDRAPVAEAGARGRAGAVAGGLRGPKGFWVAIIGRPFLRRPAGVWGWLVGERRSS